MGNLQCSLFPRAMFTEDKSQYSNVAMGEGVKKIEKKEKNSQHSQMIRLYTDKTQMAMNKLLELIYKFDKVLDIIAVWSIYQNQLHFHIVALSKSNVKCLKQIPFIIASEYEFPINNSNEKYLVLF